MYNQHQPPIPSPNNLQGLFDKHIDVREIQCMASNPSFYLIKRNEADKAKTFNGVSPFKINEFIKKYIGATKSTSRLRDGSLLLEVCTSEQSKKVASLTLLGTFPVIAETHKTLNTSKGVIFCHDLVGIDESTILEELKNQRVTEVKNIMTRKDGSLKPSPLHILTFDTVTLPENVFVGFIRVPVRQHIPNPIRCLRCQKFGHVQHTCERPHVCPNCAKPADHGDGPCDRETKCLNCGGSHPAWSRDCPVWKKEKKITEIKIKDKLSIIEARKKYNSISPSFNLSKSFAEAAAAKPTVTSQEDVHPSKPSELKEIMAMMVALLAGQKENKEKLEEQSKQIEEQTKKIDEQTKQIQQLRAENEKLKNNNYEMEEELVALRAKKQSKPHTDSDGDQTVKSTAKKFKRSLAAQQSSNEEGHQPGPTSEDDMDVDGTSKPGRKPHSRVDFLKKS